MMSPAWLETSRSTPPAAIGGGDAFQYPAGSRRGKDRPGYVHVQQTLAHPADHGGFVPRSVADHQPDPALRFGDRPHHQGAGQPDYVGVGRRIALQHLLDRPAGLVEEPPGADAHAMFSLMKRAASAASRSRSSERSRHA